MRFHAPVLQTEFVVKLTDNEINVLFSFLGEFTVSQLTERGVSRDDIETIYRIHSGLGDLRDAIIGIKRELTQNSNLTYDRVNVNDLVAGIIHPSFRMFPPDDNNQIEGNSDEIPF